MGSPFGADEFTLSDTLANGRKCVSSRHSYGFQIVADPRNRGAYPLKVWLVGPDNQSNDFLYVTSPQWHRGEVAKIEIEALTDNPAGNWFVNHAVKEGCGIYPSTPPVNPLTDFPAASGGTGTLVSASEVQALTRASPNSSAPAATAYLSAAGISAFFAIVSAAVGATVTAGSLDIWRYDTGLARWVLVLNMGIPTGQRDVAIPLDLTLIGSGNIFAAFNGVTFSDAAATGLMSLRGM